MGDNRRKVGNYLVDTDALMRLSVPFLILLFANMMMAWVVSWQIGKFAMKHASMDSQLLTSFQLLDREIQSTMIWGQVAFGAVTFLLWVLYTHRIFGPALAIRNHVKALLAGRYGEKVILRKFDEFKPLADDLNTLSERLKARPSSDRK